MVASLRRTTAGCGRLAETRENKEELRADHRRIRQAEIVSTVDEQNERQEADVDEEDEEAPGGAEEEDKGETALKGAGGATSSRRRGASLRMSKSMSHGTNREIARIKRDREERDARLKEKEEIGEESADDVIQSAGKDDIYTAVISLNLLERIKMDKSILPKVMQVKPLRAQWQNKVDTSCYEDTTDWNAPWATNGSSEQSIMQKMAGMNAPIAKPKGSKKLKDWDANEKLA
ncbi:hypothetical protein HU200_066472 [Digitaria exilis]|uniref:Uncharacterized protein n=1 Tax=Digitaria exilis TaxID=1010633 RepID=A0A834ZWK1_9POAL|nr:hypothetical protein HU200_066472 [Digitaria exilis]